MNYMKISLQPMGFGIMVLTALSLFGCRKLSPEDELIIAAQNGNIEVIQKLISSKINVNCKDHSPDAGTPLIWAVRCKQENAVQVLLAAGADPNIPTGTGEAPLFFATGTSQDN